MSLSSKLINSIEDSIKNFCKTISKTYDLNENDLYNMWNGGSSITSTKTSKKESPVSSPAKSPTKPDSDTEITREKIMVANKDMLAAMCKKKGLKMSGKKEELVQRLLDSLKESSEEPKKSPPKLKKGEDSPVVKSVKDKAGELAIRRNKFGHFEHMQTHLIFNSEKLVFGKQLDDGTVADLVDEDIELCKKYKLPYKLPDNLNTNKSLKDVKVDEIDEEEVLDESDDEQVEEDMEDEVLEEDC